MPGETMRKTRCMVCSSDDRKKIERLLIKQESFASITREYNIKYWSLKNHLDYHMSKAVVKTMMSAMKELKVPVIKPEIELPKIKNLAGCLDHIHGELLWVKEKAKKERNYPVMMQALKHDLDCIGVIMKGKEIMLSYQAQGSWQKILPKILKAVEHNPEAKTAISKALQEASYQENILTNLK
jgi:hypothetical protein